MVRQAFTLIELIFAIVVIAISIVSLPMMTQSTLKGIDVNILQETIFATGAILNESTTYYWDMHSMDDALTTAGGYSRVVNTGGCLGAAAPYKRIGHINRQCLDNNATVPNNVGDTTSIEWAANTYNNLEILTGNAARETYKNSYSATVTVTRCTAGCVQFGLEANNPNLKELTIDVKRTDQAGTVVELHAYTANIGEVAIASKIL